MTFFKKHRFAICIAAIMTFSYYGAVVSMLDNLSIIELAVVVFSTIPCFFVGVVMWYRPRPFFHRRKQFVFGIAASFPVAGTLLATSALFFGESVFDSFFAGVAVGVYIFLYSFDTQILILSFILGALINRSQTKIVEENQTEALTQVFG